VTPNVTMMQAVMVVLLLIVSSALNSLAVTKTDIVSVTKTGLAKTVESISVYVTPSAVDVVAQMLAIVRPALSTQSVTLTDSVYARTIGKAQTALPT